MRFRGQTSAPIELVVAIIIMAMSMTLALYVMGQTSDAQCEDQMKSEMRGLSSAMLDVSLGSPPTAKEVQIQLRACGTYNIEAVRFVRYTAATFCGECPSQSGGCWKVVPVSYDRKLAAYTPVFKAVTCIDLPQQVELTRGPASECGDLSQTACPLDAKESSNPNCNEGKYGAAYGTEQSVASWETFGKQQGVQTYFVKLTKVQPAAGTGKQTIEVCINSAKKTSSTP